MLSVGKRLFLKLLPVYLLTLITTSCTSSINNETENRSDRYLECETLADKATLLGVEALNSGETNYSSPEWQSYDEARDRYNILNCKEWWPLPFK